MAKLTRGGGAGNKVSQLAGSIDTGLHEQLGGSGES